MDAKINATILKLLKPFRPKRIGVFGSYSCDEMNENSDIDILYSFGTKISLLDLAGLKLDLEDAQKRRVDLVSEKGIDKYIKPYILKDLKIIYQE